MNVNVFGYYGHNNAGDDAFALFFEELFGARLRLHHTRCGDDPVFSGLILGGGAVVNEYFFDRMPRYERLDVIGCSLGDDSDLALLEAVQERLGIIALRSATDTALLRAAGIAAETYPDLVFALTPPSSGPSVEAVRALAPLPTHSGFAERTAVIFLSDHYAVRTTEDEQRHTIIETFKNQLAVAFDQMANSFNLVFVPMSVWYSARDAAFAHDVIARMRFPEKATLIERYLGPRAIMALTASVANVVISMKYHGLVFGILCGKAVINIADSNKNVDLMTEGGIGDFDLRISGVTADNLIDAVGRSERSIPRILDLRRRYRAALAPLKVRLLEAYPLDGQERPRILL
jgi:polysaccharide pyruvyl transferase WcaK-like protein